MKLNRFAPFFMALLSPIALWAHEGFNVQPSGLPTAVADAWPSVFLLTSSTRSSYETETAFLVNKETVSKNSKLYFLTANHGINKDCLVGKVCQGTRLLQNSAMPQNQLGLILARFFAQGLKFSKVTLIKRNIDLDLALLSVLSDDRETLPRALNLSGTGSVDSALYAIGFPETSERHDKRLVGGDPEILKKRWSKGDFVNFVFDPENPRNIQLGLTTDSLSGNSGGPILNSNGEVVGVVEWYASPATGEYAVREGKNAQWQTLANSRDAIREFLKP